ncbi:MAG: DUF4105 domain-containing protein [Paludibacteraceae bacterium]|nr:DUF4105 domain-containing protein [Paludibacteraceae bacterium]
MSIGRKQMIVCAGLLLAMFHFVPAHSQTLSEQATISLLTCSPGQPLYFHYGHSALRVQDPAFINYAGDTTAIDWTFNYGIFDFNTDHFYWKFCKGETDYMLGLENTSEFEWSAAYCDRRVFYQPLILTHEEKQAILNALLINYQPKNRVYRYNFVYNNCASRLWAILKSVRPEFEATGMTDRTWRNEISYYSGRYTWGNFGINLAFGYEADQKMSTEGSLFLPENLMNYLSQEGFTEDESIGRFTPRDGIFWTSPELVILLLVLLLGIMTFADIWRKKQTWQMDIVFYSLYLIAGIILLFLYTASEHPFVGSNLNVLYLNPLWIIPLVAACFARGRKAILIASPWLMGGMLVVMGIFLFKGQSLHLMSLLVECHMIRLYLLHHPKLNRR